MNKAKSDDLDLDTLFNEISGDDEVVIDFSSFQMQENESSDSVEPAAAAETLPEEVAVNATLVAEIPATEVVKIVRKSGEKKGRGGQTAVCIARCNIVREIFAEAAKTGEILSTTAIMEKSNGRFKYTDVILVSKQLKAAGKITEALKGRQAHWSAVV